KANLLLQSAAAPLPYLAALQRRDPAPARPAAEDAAQHRRPGTPARPGPRPLAHRQALPRALDGRAAGLARLAARAAPGGAVLGGDASAASAPGAPRPRRGPPWRAARRGGAPGERERPAQRSHLRVSLGCRACPRGARARGALVFRVQQQAISAWRSSRYATSPGASAHLPRSTT